MEHIKQNAEMAVSTGLVSSDLVNQIINRSARRNQLHGVLSISKRNAYRKSLATEARRILELDRISVETLPSAPIEQSDRSDDPWN